LPDRAQFQGFKPFYELVSGPLHAGGCGPNELDNTLGPQVVFTKHPPADQQNTAPSSGIAFFGHIKIDGRSSPTRRRAPRAPETDPPVAVSFVGGSVTSANLAEQGSFGEVALPPIPAVTYAVQQSNPHIKYFNSQDHGYCIVEVTPERVVCTMKALAGGTQAIKTRNPQAPMTTLRTFEVRNGESRPRQL
jgi:phosphodiesterase/alkaline phosphatase D-like protein